MKKLLLTLLLVLLTTLFAADVCYAEDYLVGDIEIIPGENGISVTADITAYNSLSSDGCAIGAMYYNGALVGMDTQKISNAIAGVKTFVKFNLPKASYDEIKVFVLADLESIMPLSKNKSIKTENSSKFAILYTLYADNSDPLNAGEPKAVLLTQDGKFTTYNFAKNVKINASILPDGNPQHEYMTVSKENIKADVTLPFANRQLVPGTQQIVMYSINDDGLISELYWGAGISIKDENYLHDYEMQNAGIFDEVNSTLGAAKISEYFRFITLERLSYQNMDPNANELRQNQFGVASASFLNKNDTYSYDLVYNKNTGNAEFGIIFDYMPKVSPDSPVMYVTAVTDLVDEYNDSYTLISGYVNGEKTSVALSCDMLMFNRDNIPVWSNISKGSVIQYSIDSNAIRVLLTDSEIMNITSGIMNGVLSGENENDSATGFVYVGQLHNMEDGIAYFNTGMNISIPDNSPAVLMRAGASGLSQMHINRYITIETAETNIMLMPDMANGDYVFVYKYNNEVLSLVIIDSDYDDIWNNSSEGSKADAIVSGFSYSSPFTDVSEADNSFEAFYILNQLGYLKGYSDNTARPDAEIKRAEFLAVLMKAAGYEDASVILSENESGFADVPVSHWANGYINAALNREIIPLDNEFRPSDTLSFEDAIKYTVNALGYKSECNTLIDYLIKAMDLGLLDGAEQSVGDIATRETVANLIYNALDVPNMEMLNYGTEIVYEVPTNYHTFLSNAGIAKAKGTVEEISFAPQSKVLGFTVQSISKQFDNMNDYYYDNTITMEGDLLRLPYKNGISVKPHYSVDAYIDTNGINNELVALYEPYGRNNTLTISGKQAKNGMYYERANLSYYKNSSDVDAKANIVKLSQMCKIFSNMNNVSDTSAMFSANYTAGLYPYVTLIDNNSYHEGYDVICAEKYYAGLVSDINYSSYLVSFDVAHGVSAKTSIALNPYSQDYTFSIKDEQGNNIKFESIKSGDMLNVFTSEDMDGYRYYDVIVTRNVIEGTVEEQSDSPNYYKINNELYFSYQPLITGDKGYFYIDLYGKIVMYLKENISSEDGFEYDEISDNTENEVYEYKVKPPFSDVSNSDESFEAFYTLNALGLYKGYEDGTAKPEANIRRDEYTALLIKALGYEEVAQKIHGMPTPFDDVESSHWAAGYINVALNQGIINADENIFRPEDNLLYSEAVEMMVNALGYGPTLNAEVDADYIFKAIDLGIIKNSYQLFNEVATRETAANLLYNSLSVPMMEKNSNGSLNIPENYNTILSKNNIARAEGVVTSVRFDGSSKLEFAIGDISKQFDTSYYYRSDNALGRPGDILVLNYADTVTPLKHYKLTAFIDASDLDNPVILGVFDIANASKTLTITAAQAKNGYIGTSRLSYYKTDSDTDSLMTDVRLSSNCAFYVNRNSYSMPAGDTIISSNYSNGVYPETILIDNDYNTAGYDIVIVKEYFAGVVEEIKSNKIYFSDTAGMNSRPMLSFDNEDELCMYDIYDENNNHLDLESIEKDDVLSVFISHDTITASQYYEIHVTSSPISGRVEYKSEKPYYYVINGKEYFSYVNLSSGDSGNFYIDMYGKILKYEDTKIANFAILYALYADNSDPINCGEPKAVLLTEDGKFTTYDFADTVSVNGDTAISGGVMKVTKDTIKADVAANYYSCVPNSQQIVMYNLNAKGLINELYWGNGINYKDDRYRITSSNGSRVAYKENTSRLGSTVIPEDMTFITLKRPTYQDMNPLNNELRQNEFGITDTSVLTEMNDEGYLYDLVYSTENRSAVFGILFDCKPKVYGNADVMLVTSVETSETDNGTPAAKVSGYVNNEKVSVLITSDTYYYDRSNQLINYYYIDTGALIQYTGKETAYAVRILAAPSEILAVAQGASGAMDGYVIETPDGIITDESNNKLGSLYVGKLSYYKDNSADFTYGHNLYVPETTPASLVKFITDNAGVITSIGDVYGGERVSLSSAEIAYEGNDIVMVYSFDGEAKTAVILDAGNDNPIEEPEFFSGVVAYINASNSLIYFDEISLGGIATMKLDPASADYTYTITGDNGQKEFAHIKRDDVLSVKVNTEGDIKHYDIYVNSKKLQGVSERKDINTYVINGAEYKSYNYIPDETEHIYYADTKNNILKYEEVNTEESKFAILYALYADNNDPLNAGEPKAVLLTQDGKFTTYDFADNVKINASGLPSGYPQYEYMTVTKDGIKSEVASYYRSFVPDCQQIVMYNTNYDGLITELYWGDGITYRDDRYAINTSLGNKVLYKENTSKLGNVTIPDDITFITLEGATYQDMDPSNAMLKQSDFGTADKSILSEKNYEGYLYDIVLSRDDKTAVFGILFDCKPKVYGDSDIMLVTAVNDATDSEGFPTRKVSGWVGNEKVSFIIEDDAYYYDRNNTLITGNAVIQAICSVGKGALIQYDGKEFSEAVRILVTPDEMLATAQGMSGSLNGDIIVDANNNIPTTEINDKIGSLYVGQLSDYTDGSADFIGGRNLSVPYDTPTTLIRFSINYNNYVINSIGNIYGGDVMLFGVAESRMNTYEDNINDDIVIVYSYAGDAKASVILDTNNDDIWN